MKQVFNNPHVYVCDYIFTKYPEKLALAQHSFYDYFLPQLV